MRSLFLSLASACLFLAPSSAIAAYTTVTHSELQSLYYNSDTNVYGSQFTVEHPTAAKYPVQLIGVVINNPSDMLDYSNSATSTNGPQWQMFIQALPTGGTYGAYNVDAGDFGGTALYMMRDSFKKNQKYSTSEWTDEMNRINNANLTDGTTLTTGDVVLVQANAPGMYYQGKYNINEQHMKSSSTDFTTVTTDYDFNITVLKRGVTTTATEISLANLKDSSNQFLFDTGMDGDNLLIRASGCEHYQGRLVTLHDLLLVNPTTASWTADSIVEVKQLGDDNRTFNLRLGRDAGLSDKNPGSSLFDMTAILNQEDTSGTSRSGYQLWLTSASNITFVPEPNSLILLVTCLIGLATYAWRKRK